MTLKDITYTTWIKSQKNLYGYWECKVCNIRISGNDIIQISRMENRGDNYKKGFGCPECRKIMTWERSFYALQQDEIARKQRNFWC